MALPVKPAIEISVSLKNSSVDCNPPKQEVEDGESVGDSEQLSTATKSEVEMAVTITKKEADLFFILVSF